MPIYNAIGIKYTLGYSFFVSALGMLCIALDLSSSRLAMIIFVLWSNVGVSATFNIIYIANGLIFPENWVASSYTITNLFCRTATIFAP